MNDRPTRSARRRAPSIDNQLGDRLRLLRHSRNLNQGQLGNLIGVTAQQIHRYERGKSSITAVNLWRIAQALNAPAGYFFEGLDERPRAQE
jgi:transcriptional regulator with XRE-family HTH domain